MRYRLKKDKKGFNFLGEETLKVLIAVICIGFLVYLVVAIYFSVNKSDKVKQAEGILTGNEGIITKIKAGKVPFIFDILSTPAGWYLLGFTGGKKPNTCIGEKCLCVCEKASEFNLFFDKDAQLKKCDKGGVCSIISNLKEDFAIEIKKGKTTSISISQIEGNIEIKEN
jgi:hypothetical protein